MGGHRQAIKRKGLPITKDGKGKQSIVEVVDRLIDAKRIAQTDDLNKVRYEPVAA